MEPDYPRYKNGFRRWESFPLISRISLIVSILSLILSVCMLLWR